MGGLKHPGLITSIVMKRSSSNCLSLNVHEVNLLRWNAHEEEYVWKVQLEKINIFGAGKIPATQTPQANKMTNNVLATSGCYCHTLWILAGCAETGLNSKRGARTTVVSNNLYFVAWCAVCKPLATHCYSDLLVVRRIVSDCLVIPNRKHTHVAHYEGSNYISACWLQTTTPMQHHAHSIEMIAV